MTFWHTWYAHCVSVKWIKMAHVNIKMDPLSYICMALLTFNFYFYFQSYFY